MSVSLLLFCSFAARRLTKLLSSTADAPAVAADKSITIVAVVAEASNAADLELCKYLLVPN